MDCSGFAREESRLLKASLANCPEEESIEVYTKFCQAQVGISLNSGDPGQANPRTVLRINQVRFGQRRHHEGL